MTESANRIPKPQPSLADLGSLDRPVEGTWLALSARKVASLIESHHGEAGFDVDHVYLLSATALHRRCVVLAAQTKWAPDQVEKYLDDARLSIIAGEIGEALTTRDLGADPFLDTNLVAVDAAAWAHSISSLQAAGRAARDMDPVWAAVLTELASSMTRAVPTIPAMQPPRTRVEAPVAGARYALQFLAETAKQIGKWGPNPNGPDARELKAGVQRDANRIRSALAA